MAYFIPPKKFSISEEVEKAKEVLWIAIFLYNWLKKVNYLVTFIWVKAKAKLFT